MSGGPGSLAFLRTQGKAAATSGLARFWRVINRNQRRVVIERKANPASRLPSGYEPRFVRWPKSQAPHHTRGAWLSDQYSAQWVTSGTHRHW